MKTKTLKIGEAAHQKMVEKQKEIYNQNKVIIKLADMADMIITENITNFQPKFPKRLMLIRDHVKRNCLVDKLGRIPTEEEIEQFEEERRVAREKIQDEIIECELCHKKIRRGDALFSPGPDGDGSMDVCDDCAGV